MSKKADELIQQNMSLRWSTTSNPAAGTSAIMQSKAALTPASRQNMDLLMYSVANLTAAAIQSTLTIANGTAGGTVLAQIRLAVPAATSKESIGDINLPGKLGSRFSIDFGVPAASVLQNIAAAGWEEGNR